MLSLSLSLSSCLVFATLISGAILASTTVSADDSFVSDVSITVKESCTFKGSLTNPHTASVNSGTVTSDIGTTTLKAFCNDSGGFAIYAIGYTNEEYGNTMLSSQTIGSSADIATGPATSGGTSNWAMKLATDSSATYPIALDNGFGSYSAVPSAYTQVASRASGTDLGTEATGATLTTTYQTYIASDQPADSYLGKVKYTMVHPSNYEPNMPHTTAAGKISYYPNGNGKVVDTMGDQEAESNSEVVLWPSNFQRPGYGFAGWNTKFDMSGTNYGPMETITTPDMTTEGLSLYANWIKSASTMQGWAGCPNMSIGDVTALTDNRDGNTYAVAKLADGKCWMIENLRLDNTAELTATNTNNPSLPLTDSWYYANQQGTLTTSNHLSASSDPTSTDPDTAWCGGPSGGFNYGYCINQSMLYTGNITDAVVNMTIADANVYSYGNYYNWYSATAGNGTYSMDSGSTDGDICPTGWHLPTGKDATGDFGVLDLALGGTGVAATSSTTPTGATMSAAWRSWPNNFVYSGSAGASSVLQRGSIGHYWSSTTHTSNSAYYLSLSSSSVRPGIGGNYKYNGKFVRCIVSSP